jgi:hypothetical protein
MVRSPSIVTIVPPLISKSTATASFAGVCARTECEANKLADENSAMAEKKGKKIE